MLNLAFDLAVLAAACGPQGGLGSQVPPALAPKMEFPAAASTAHVMPFGVRNRIAAAGAVDFDGDGSKEPWFVSDWGPDAGEFAVLMARGSDTARYRAYPGIVTPPGPAFWTDACSYSETPGLPAVLLVDPWQSRPQRLDHRFLTPVVGHRRSTVSWETTASSFYEAGIGIYEIEAGDHAGDGHPDVYTLSVLALGGGAAGTMIRKEPRLPSGPGPLVELLVPLPCDTLRIGDFDGDGSSDFALHVRGLGVAAFRDTGAGWFAFAGGVPLDPTMLRDIVIGDTNGDGRDELGVVLDGGVLLYRLLGGPQVWWFDHIPEALHNPAGVGALATAAIVDAWGDPLPEVLVWPQDGAAFAVHPFDPVTDTHVTPVVFTPPDPAAYAGSGTLGRAAVRADLDADGDDDLLVQTASGTWFSMQGPRADHRPLLVQVAGTPTPDQNGMVHDHVTVTLAPSWAATGATDVEVALYNRDLVTGAFGLHTTRLLPIATSITSFTVTVRADGSPLPIPGLFTGGESLLSIHLRRGNQRFASKLLWHDGPPGGDGSAVGVRWRLVVTPPLPAVDDELLPWN